MCCEPTSHKFVKHMGMNASCCTPGLSHRPHFFSKKKKIEMLKKHIDSLKEKIEDIEAYIEELSKG
ncbi:MAG: hypothetical protein E3J87_02710 [Candidatus Cloacimonadota bacterium]|nr:MAG: hypothetical protein E3J87_02710 [Candidatus Cloacimonadota bacterium]